MIGCIGAKQANEVRVVLVTVGGRLVVVLAEFVSDAVSGGVSKAWLGSVIVAELGCAAVTPWRTFDVTRVWRGYAGARDDGMQGGQDLLELVLWEGWCSVVSGGGVLFVLFEDRFEGGSCLSGGGCCGMALLRWLWWGTGTFLG